MTPKLHRLIKRIPLLACMGCLHAAEVRTMPLTLTEGGTVEKPAMFDGGGMVIDLGTDVSGHAWLKANDVWTSAGPLMPGGPNVAGQLAGLFIDDIPTAIPRDLAAEKAQPEKNSRCYLAPAALKPGQMGYAQDGSIYFRWPEGKMAGSARIILPPAAGTNCVTIACSHIIVRNLTVTHAANDGFNIHGKFIGIRIEKVRAIANADEGISAHGEVEMTVDGAEIAWNGSTAGGVADVGHSITAYRACRVHHNYGAAFYFSGKSHRVTDTIISAQKKDFNIVPGTAFQQERIEQR